jgi:hypothetical protein
LIDKISMLMLLLAQITLTALNPVKSAYVCFTFAANRFFSRYNFEGTEQSRERFFCQLFARVRLLSKCIFVKFLC